MRTCRGRILEGLVISDKANKTIVVNVVSRFSHPFYNKLVIQHKKYKVHDEKKEAKVGDRVLIGECRPLSKEKEFKLLEILK